MASIPTPTGYGRGGRGAALLMAMNAPVRKPGESPPSEDEGVQQKPRVMSLGRGLSIQLPTTSPSPPGPSPAAPAPPVLGLGRGALGRGLGRGLALQQPQPEKQPSPPAPQPTSQPMSIKTASPTVLPMLGRGRGLQLLSQPLSPAPSPAQSVSSIQSSAVESVAVPGPGGDAGQDDRQSRATWMQRMTDLHITDTVSISGTKGRQVNLACNYIPMRCRTGGVYQYAVSYSPPLDAKNLRISLLHEVLGKEVTKAYDGAVLFMPRELPEKMTVFETVRRSDQTPVKIMVKFVKVIPPAGSAQLYNIVLNGMMRKLKYCQVGRNYYNSHEPSQIPQHKLEVWPGYVTSIEEFEGGLMLMVDVDHRLLRTETVYNLMSDVQKRNRGGSDLKTEIARKVIGQSVMTRYNNKTYRVDDIDWSQTPMSTFPRHDKTEISYLEYYREQYGKNIEDRNQPLLVHRPKEKDRRGRRGMPEVVALIPELCYLTGLSDEMRSNFTVMKDVGSHTRLTPPQRQISLNKFVNDILNSTEARAELERWGLEINTDLLQMTGRLLQPEMIQWGGGRQQTAGEKANFNGQIGREKLIAPCDIREWLLICTKRDEPVVNNFLQMLMQESSKLGMRVSRPTLCCLPNDATATFLNEIRRQFKANQTDLVMTICPTSRDDRYNAIKKLCYVESPVASQVINTPTIRNEKKLRAVTQKIALQLNAKLGGELWALDIPVKGLMVCGIDVCHGPAGSRSSQLGFVASLNQRCTRWYSTTQRHHDGQEMADTLRMCLTKALHRYHRENHSMPDRIIIFRDGVGDGALSVVAGHEVPQIQAVFPTIQEGYHPKFAMIVVQKRINQRIMAIKGRSLENPAPGTIVDTVITRKQWYDYFLVSQHVGQGTVSPTHFVVVHDSSNWSPDVLQRLSYKLTHLYYNWPGTIRVPAPCQYAHKLAYMVSENLSGKDPAPEICDRLFYL